MSANLSGDAIRRILNACETDRSPGHLAAVATEYGLLDAELVELLRRADAARRDRGVLRRPGSIAAVVAPPAPVPPREPEVRMLLCSACQKEKPDSEFYPDPNTKSGKASACRSCQNRRNPTVARMVQTRARNRATAALVIRHREEFERLFTEEKDRALKEHYDLVQEARRAGMPDAEVARLKPGPKRAEETAATQRLDVARCQRCHTHHDDDHVCSGCGDETPLTPETVRPYLVRIWARAEGIGPVPSRGPLPARLVNAYIEAHEKEQEA